MSALILFGRVVSTEDPAKLGRIQVETVGYGQRHLLPWTRVIQPTASAQTGHLFLPEKGDEVVVLRGLDERPEGMIVLGALYNAARPPHEPDQDGKNNTKEIRTRSGQTLSFNDKSGHESITLKSGDGRLCVTLDQEKGAVLIEGDKEVRVVSNTKLFVQADKIEITGDSKITLKSESKLEISGGEITLSGQKVKIK